MALTRQFFQTPTGNTYKPAGEIERSFDKTSNLITGAMTRESERLQKRDADFGAIYENIGELEENLIQNYASIGQEAVMSARDFTKEHLKKGGNVNDPEFRLKLGQMTGRIKGMTATADRNREGMRKFGEMLYKDPHIRPEDKNQLFFEMYQDMNNPDVLISKNPYNFEEKLSKYVSDKMVFEDALKSLPTDGVYEDQFNNEKGDLKSRKLIVNPLVNKDNPFREDGRPDVVITDEFLENVRREGGRLYQKALQIAETKYPNLPKDMALKEGLRDGFSQVMGINYEESTVKSARDIAREDQVDYGRSLNNQILKKELDNFNKTEDAKPTADQKDVNERKALYEQFVEDVDKGTMNFFGKIQSPDFARDASWLTKKDQKLIEYGATDFSEWESVSPERRKEILKENNIAIPTGFWGASDSGSRKAYSNLQEKIKSDPDADKRVGVTLNVKGGTKDGNAIFEPVDYIWGEDMSRLPEMFEQFDIIRKKVKGSEDTELAPSATNTNQGGASRFNPPN